MDIEANPCINQCFWGVVKLCLAITTYNIFIPIGEMPNSLIFAIAKEKFDKYS
jgi:hypothetical protein